MSRHSIMRCYSVETYYSTTIPITRTKIRDSQVNYKMLNGSKITAQYIWLSNIKKTEGVLVRLFVWPKLAKNKLNQVQTCPDRIQQDDVRLKNYL